LFLPSLIFASVAGASHGRYPDEKLFKLTQDKDHVSLIN
jgi:hypothetical protein